MWEGWYATKKNRISKSGTTSHQLTTTSHQRTTTSHQRTTNDYPACLASSSTSSSAFANRLARCTYEMLPAWLLRLSK
jgi:hypothetical protein